MDRFVSSFVQSVISFSVSFCEIQDLKWLVVTSASLVVTSALLLVVTSSYLFQSGVECPLGPWGIPDLVEVVTLSLVFVSKSAATFQPKRAAYQWTVDETRSDDIKLFHVPPQKGYNAP